ncbi:hypothetical protein [Streptomyces sp. NRRL S-87]|uniref:hypothetical protein n=1 Tax=Streptomyces sp. NRRL S-87 TaxID=1463920 RepID=UPI0007C527D3|nr:hypothetical protein [Streptomyces sp. NRRL S-87]
MSLAPAAGRTPRAPRYAAGAALVLVLVVAARAGALTRIWEFLDFGAGVLSLVSLSAAVLWGLAATDRTVLDSGHRLLAQGVHRALAVSGLGFLGLHIWAKIAGGTTVAASAVVPFADRDRPLVIGLGTLAGYLFVSVAASGALRSAFATRSRSVWWRVLHMGAYPAWGAALVHGLRAGRAAADWVTTSYMLCLAAAAFLVALRVRNRLRGAAGTARPPAGTPEPAAAPTRADPPAAAPDARPPLIGVAPGPAVPMIPLADSRPAAGDARADLIETQPIPVQPNLIPPQPGPDRAFPGPAPRLVPGPGR